MNIVHTVLPIGAPVGFVSTALAGIQATPDEAKAMALKPADYLKARVSEVDNKWHNSAVKAVEPKTAYSWRPRLRRQCRRL